MGAAVLRRRQPVRSSQGRARTRDRGDPSLRCPRSPARLPGRPAPGAPLRELEPGRTPARHRRPGAQRRDRPGRSPGVRGQRPRRMGQRPPDLSGAAGPRLSRPGHRGRSLRAPRRRPAAPEPGVRRPRTGRRPRRDIPALAGPAGHRGRRQLARRHRDDLLRRRGHSVVGTLPDRPGALPERRPVGHGAVLRRPGATDRDADQRAGRTHPRLRRRRPAPAQFGAEIFVANLVGSRVWRARWAP